MRARGCLQGTVGFLRSMHPCSSHACKDGNQSLLDPPSVWIETQWTWTAMGSNRRSGPMHSTPTLHVLQAGTSLVAGLHGPRGRSGRSRMTGSPTSSSSSWWVVCCMAKVAVGAGYRARGYWLHGYGGQGCKGGVSPASPVRSASRHTSSFCGMDPLQAGCTLDGLQIGDGGVLVVQRHPHQDEWRLGWACC